MRPCSDITCVRLVGDLDMDNKALREERDRLRDWMEANVPEMECRNDEDCDHCVGMQILGKMDGSEL